MIDELIRAHVARVSDAIEAACERMLVTPGDYGVRVDYWPDTRVTVRLDSDVEPMVVSEFHH